MEALRRAEARLRMKSASDRGNGAPRFKHATLSDSEAVTALVLLISHTVWSERPSQVRLAAHYPDTADPG